MHRQSLRAAILAAAFVVALPTWAESSQQAQITNVRIRLVDLDTQDGITPSITFAEGGFVGTWIPGDAAPIDLVQTAFPLGTALTVKRPAGSQTIRFDMLAGDLLGGGPGPGAVATHVGAGAPGLAGEGQVIFTDFTLTPNTRIEISATGSASTSGYAGAGGLFDAWAGAGVNIFSLTLEASFATDFINAYTNALGQSLPDVKRDLFAAYDNQSSMPFTARISAVAYLGASETSPVPEPPAWALLAGGLLGLAARRSRKPQA